MADAASATGASAGRPAVGQGRGLRVSESTSAYTLFGRSTVLSDDEVDEDDEDDDAAAVGVPLTAMALERSGRPTVETTPVPSLASRSASAIPAEHATAPPQVPTPPQARNQRMPSGGESGAATRSEIEWDVDGDDGWMPKPARLHSGKTRSCAVCFAPLQYTTMQSWDEYVQSEEYLQRLQDNLLSDTFISSLICGESTSGGDLPTEHRMHKNRKLKCRQSVHDYVNMTSAGVIDQAYKEKSSVRILEEMLLNGLSTPLFANVLERRLAVISHSTAIARALMHESQTQRLPREVATSAPNIELHHLAIQTLSVLLQSFDFESCVGTNRALQAFQEMTRLLTCFPALSLYSFWSPVQRSPEEPLVLNRSMVEASSVATSPRLMVAEFAIDGSDTSFWQSQTRPGIVYFNIRHRRLSDVSSIFIRWHLKSFSKVVNVQYRLVGSDDFLHLSEQIASSSNGPECFETRFPQHCEEVRLVMSGIPTVNRTSCYAIENLKLNTPIANSLFVDPKKTLSDVAAWLGNAIGHCNEDIVIEAISALRSWTLSTASLGSVLAFIRMLRKVQNMYPCLTKQPSVAKFATDQGTLLLRGIRAYREDEVDRIAKAAGKKSTSESRKIRAVFEPSCCSSGVTVEDSGVAVRTRETSYQYAAVNVGITSGRASWKFRLDNDTVDDEMTCFGAAILPVTVSGYDSSPNLWMLRGYNGNLYARGHKLNRSIGKVHPGDVVQIDVDMAEGVLSYKINDTDYGVVFTDLGGHEVYPAVSFYGSGKVITLLSVEKWDDVDPGTSAVEPVFLSNLKEYHYSVGYGTLGKGTQLGYASDSGSRVIGSTTTPSATIQVLSEHKQRSLSTHPPARGDALVVYDLNEAYDKLIGIVAINDDVLSDALVQRAVSVIFSVMGDGKTLWQSKPVTQARSLSAFEVDVRNVRMLELRASCPGSNHCAHAVWVDPHLIPLEEWKCVECQTMNKGSMRNCMVCRTQRGVCPEISKNRDCGSSQPSASILIDTVDSDNLSDLILSELVELTELDQVAQRNQRIKSVRFEQPFCRQPCDEVFCLLLEMLPSSRLDHKAAPRLQYILGILQANLYSLASYDVTPSDLLINVSTLDHIKKVLENLARIYEPDQALCKGKSEVEEAAAKALIAGLPVLYTPFQKIQLLLTLLRANGQRQFRKSSAKLMVLSSMLSTLALPGRDGILNFLPAATSSNELNASIPVNHIDEVVLLLITAVCGRENEDDGAEAVIAEAAMRLLQSYQLLLVSEALEATTRKPSVSSTNHRAYIQEATINFSSLLLRHCGNTVGKLLEQQFERALQADKVGDSPMSELSVAVFKLPILSRLLPWLISCLCLLRRQSWLAVPILPSAVKFAATMDQLCSELAGVKSSEARIRRLERFAKARAVEAQEVERLLAMDKALAMHHQASKPMYNVFKQLYTGDKDHFEGQIGFQFEATSTFSIIALGRSVNPIKNNGQLVRQHTIRLWEEASQALVAQVTVSATSRKDDMGYAYEPLSTPVKLTQGKLYRLTTHEFANGGDPWYKKENLPDEEYDASYIKILRDCYASGSTSFPNSQNLSGAAYGVPTFLVEGENPMSKVPQFIAPYGSTSLKLSIKRKSPGVTISHSGSSAHVLDSGTDVWRSCFLNTAAYSGVHAVDFVLKCGKAGGVSSGHICIGLDWSVSPIITHHNNFLGLTPTSIGWMPSIGSLWVMGRRISYGMRKQVNAGDILTVVVDFDHCLISFLHNGVDMGMAFGCPSFSPAAPLASDRFPARMLAGVSLNGTLDIVHVRPAGIAGSTLRLHWLHDLHNSVASFAGRIASTLIAGNPVDNVEEELLPWLQSPLLSGGVSSQLVGQVGSELPDWNTALAQEEALWRSAPGDGNGAVVRPTKQVERVLRESSQPRLVKRPSFFDEIGLEESIFMEDLVKDMGDTGPSAIIISWLEKAAPDRSFLSRLGKFPMCERPMFAALTKHSPAHILHEVQAIVLSSRMVDGSSSADHIDLVPSDDLAVIWKRIVMMRHWLIKTRQEYRARTINEDGTAPELSVSNKQSASVSGELEMRVTVASTFDELALQIHERASFLCILSPPSEDRERMRVESQLALSNLAEKWSSQKTPPSLEPMIERWKSLGESDSSKWSGVVDVLRAQHRWRTRRASVHITSNPIPQDGGSVQSVVEDDEEEEKISSKRFMYRNSFSAMLRACDLYIRNGIGAPPEILRTLLDRRRRRSECRVFGLEAMKSLICSLSMDSTRHGVIIFLRPAFRGFSEDEKVSRDVNDGQVIAETFRATVRHHYLKGLEGCSRRIVQRVQRSFWNLYSVLASLVAPAGSDGGVIDVTLRQSIFCAWCLDFEQRDHSYLLKSGILATLQNEFSLTSILQRTHQEVDELKQLQDATARDVTSVRGAELNWHPLSEDFVQRSAISGAFLTKRDIMLLVLRAPRFACSDKWWKDNLIFDDKDVEASSPTSGPPSGTGTRHTISSMSLRYSELLRNLQAKFSWCEERLLGRKVVQFGVNCASSSSHSGVPPPAKADQISYAEIPGLGETVDFTMEMWVLPTELGGYRAIRADNGFHGGSVYIELAGRYLQVAINGNAPREQLFKTHMFDTHTWTHVAVIYDNSAKQLELMINGRLIERRNYTSVTRSIVFRESRIGCWVSEPSGATAISTGPQRVFKGAIAELRLWKVVRSAEQVRCNYQRAVPCGVDENLGGALLGLWHLDEGEGVCGNNRIETSDSHSRPQIMDTAGCNASLVTCHWIHSNVPVWSGKKIDSLTDLEWKRILSAVACLQRFVRRWFAGRCIGLVHFARKLNEKEEDSFDDQWGDDGVGDDALMELQEPRNLASKLLTSSTDDLLIHQKQTNRCAWIVFRCLAHIAICGTQERTDSEATSVAAAAKSRRKQRIQSDSAIPDTPSPLASVMRRKSSFEEDDAAKTAEIASDAAKTAASSRQLEEPALQVVWFSNEVHRKVFEILEKELSFATTMIQTAEGLTRAQRMLRSSSTPIKDRDIAVRTQNSVLVSGSVRCAPQGSRTTAFSSLRSDVVLEPLEVETHVFGILTFVLSQSTSQVALTHLARPRILRELLQLLRIGSPRSQRTVKLILRRVCASGSVGPQDVAGILGSESMLVDLLLDQVAESVCSTAAPIPTLGLSVTAAAAAAAPPVTGEAASMVAPITESLSNPVGFRSGQVYLAAASESVALLRLLMRDQRWGAIVTELLSTTVRNVTPILARRRSQGGEKTDGGAASDIRMRTAIIRAVGALCVLGSHTDCIRIGGKVEVTANEAQSDGKGLIDYGFNASGDSTNAARATLATMIELNGRSSTARVVFDGTDESSDPSHNVQEVNLATVSPVEEVHLPSNSTPLSVEMLPVVLKLASLDESDVIASFDDLWRMQIRSRALLALESILRHSASAAGLLIDRNTIPRTLLDAALSPVTLSTFVSVPFLQERGRMILCRLIEASTPFGEPMFRGLPDPKPFVPEDASDGNPCVIESSDDPVEEETEEYRVRRGFASTLAAMGFEFDLCMAALEHTRNDPNQAVEWLMGPGATAYQERQEARRLAAATIASRRSTSASTSMAGVVDGVSASLEARAEELQSISGMPYSLAFAALEMSNANPNNAMEWLMEHGARYADQPERLTQLSDEMQVEHQLALSDAAALEGIDQSDQLVASTSSETLVDLNGIGAATKTSDMNEESTGDTTNIMAVTLAPILAPLPEKPPGPSSARKKATDSSTESGYAALDPEYLSPYVLLTVSNEIGPVQRLSATGRTGVFRMYSPKDGVLITFLNPETGAYEEEWHAPKDVRRITRIYDEPLCGVDSIHRVALRTEKALSTHYARRGVAALLRAWESVTTLESSGTTPLSDTILPVVGGPRQFVNLLKLVAASEMVFSRKHGPTEMQSKSSKNASTAATRSEDPVSILKDLQAIALRILQEEADCGKLPCVSTLWPGSNSSSPLSSTPETRTTPTEAVITAGDEGGRAAQSTGQRGDENDDLYRAIALSMQDVTSGEVCIEEEEDESTHVQCLYSSNPRGVRTRQPSYAEAQEVASAYLGGSIDEHNGLLSSVLVKECVSHFVESTRVAGEGSGGGSVVGAEVLEFQSLHPYYGRCEYARAVVMGKSHRCLRVKFDQRCKLGTKAKLTFYADPAFEKVLAVIDATSTSPSSSRGASVLSDLVVHSHQFWFKFTASEEDLTKNHGYGYRFQVRPMQSISWANENEVQSNASLEWACWVLDFLLNQATDLVAHGAVHNRNVYGALVRYLRSSGAPFKGNVIRLLVQLLHTPERFPVTEIPDLESLLAIGRLAVAKAKEEMESGKMFLSAQLLQLVELSVVTKRASQMFQITQARVTESDTTANFEVDEPITESSLKPPVGVDRMELPDVLNDLVVVAEFLLGRVHELPARVLTSVWLDVFGSADIIETEHPYSATCKLDGVLDFAGAQSLTAAFDSRCATVPGAELLLRVLQESGGGSDLRSAWTFSGLEMWPSGPVDMSGGTRFSYRFQGGENPDARFGVSVCVVATGLSPELQFARATVSKLQEAMRILRLQRSSNPQGWTSAMDGQLVEWVNNNVESPGGSASTSSITSVDLRPSEIRLHRIRDALRCSQLLDKSLTQLQLRFSLLKYFNQCLKKSLPLLDMRDAISPWTVAYMLRQLGHCVFFDIKNALIDAAIDATSVPGDTNSSTNTARITLDRLQALESRDDREVEPSVSECFFAQAFRQLHQVDTSLFRRKIDNKGRLFSVKFRGEEGVDWGGVYREGVNSMVDDLFSAHFNLFVLCPNGQHDTGTNRAMYLPNPKCTSPVAIQMYEFVGKLLGISLRTHGDFPFAFPSLVWKQLIGEPVGRSDLEGTDAMFVQMLDAIQNCERDGIFTEEEFEAAFEGLDLRFAAFDCNGHEVELVEGGKQKHVKFSNRLEYCQLAESYRLHESAKQIAAMIRGLATIFPIRTLTLLTWHEMEMLTCGSPKIDISLWKQHTRYDGYNENDDTVRLFWEAMESFTDEQRSDFVRFAWGRSRLPRGKWPQPFKLTKKGGRDSTLSLPVAHTCFFSVELPPYTTLEKMTTMLLATINFGLGGILMA